MDMFLVFLLISVTRVSCQITCTSNVHSPQRCEQDYIYSTEADSCYRVMETETTWSEAKSNCQADNANLLVLNDAQEQDVIANLVPAELDSKGLWVDSQRHDQESSWSWSDDAELDPSLILSSGCPDGWYDGGTEGHCFYFGNVPALKWQEAQEKCVSMDANLASINTEEDQNYIQSSVTHWIQDASEKKSIWIGVYGALNTSGHLVWYNVDGSSLQPDVLRWDTGEPNNNKGDESCVELYVSAGRAGSLNDVKCDTRDRSFGYLCKFTTGIGNCGVVLTRDSAKGTLDAEDCDSLLPSICEAKDICDPVSADVTFVLDASFSIGKDTLQQQKQYIIDFVNRFHIGPETMQVAVVMCSYTAVSPLLLNHHDNKETLIEAINSLGNPSHIGPSYIDAGLKATGDWVFQSGNGSRAEAQKYVLVLTDGMATHESYAKTQSLLLQNTFPGIKVIPIATGSQILHEGLLSIASSVNYKNIYYITNNDVQDRIIHDIDASSCRECTLIHADVLVLFDSASGSAISKQQSVIYSLLGVLNIGLDGVRVSFVQFTDKVKEITTFNQNPTRKDLKTSINSGLDSGGTPNFNLALIYAITEGFSSAKGARSDVRQIILVMSSANFKLSATDTQLIKDMKATGTIFVAIGTGKGANYDNMQQIASDPGFVFRVGTDVYTKNSVVQCLVTLTQFYRCTCDPF